VMLLPSLPLTPNGKVDRRALPQPKVVITSTSYVQPQTQLEQLIAQIWKTVLQVPQVGLQDNFFDLGGHSLLMAQVQFQLQKQIQQEVSVVDLFQYPTVQSLAQYLSSQTILVETAQSKFQSVRDRVQKQKSALNRQRKFRNQG
ncbi:MAG TPA: phosphopantetheine-binding protein, partial [Allocoleopsis sp.]